MPETLLFSMENIALGKIREFPPLNCAYDIYKADNSNKWAPCKRGPEDLSHWLPF